MADLSPQSAPASPDYRHDPVPTSSPATPGFFSVFLLLSTLALAVLCFMLTRENRRLKAELAARTTPAPADIIKPGDRLGPLTLLRPDGSLRPLDFADPPAADSRPTLLLITAAGCGYCAQAVPVWDKALTDLGLTGETGAGWLNIAAVQTDARNCADLRLLPPSIPVFMAKDARETWLRRIHVEPSALLVDARGTVVHAWLGLPDAADEPAIRAALLDAATGGGK